MNSSKITLFFIGLVFICSKALAQNQVDPIVIKKNSGTHFTQNDKNLKIKQLIFITENSPDALAVMKKARINTGIANTLGFVGGGMVGWQLGQAVAGGTPNWVLAGVGAGIIIVAIPISIQAKNQTIEAIELYNNGLPQTEVNKLKLDLLMGFNGVGLKLSL
jgi:hypothetical protein